MAEIRKKQTCKGNAFYTRKTIKQGEQKKTKNLGLSTGIIITWDVFGCLVNNGINDQPHPTSTGYIAGFLKRLNRESVDDPWSPDILARRHGAFSDKGEDVGDLGDVSKHNYIYIYIYIYYV